MSLIFIVRTSGVKHSSSTENPISHQRSHIVIVILMLPEPPLSALPSLAPPLRESSPPILTEHVEFPDFPEGRAKLLDAESVDNGVDGRVAVSEDDGDVDQKPRLVTFWAKECDAVEDVKWQPADGEEEKNECERLGQLQLLAKVTAGVCVACRDLQGMKEKIISEYNQHKVSVSE